jgi:hypothetical protein
MKMKSEEEIRQLAIGVLKSKGLSVSMIGFGSGVPKSSRLALIKPGQSTASCVVKVTTSGRVSFPYKDGKWTPLHLMDFVLYTYARDDGKVRLQMFKREVVEKAFDTLRHSLSQKGMEHIPHWLAPYHEEGERFIGSGFGDKAEWTVELNAEEVSKPTAPASLSDAIELAKGIIGSALGRPASEIDLTVSFRS